MSQYAPVHDDADAAKIWRSFPHWINVHHSKYDDRDFQAADMPNGEPLRLAVTMYDKGQPIASYKCGISHIRDRHNAWTVFAPLVVVWECRRPVDGFNLGRTMIAHLSTAARKFHRAHARWNETILIASGNLTEEKGGARFFRTLGWDIVTPQGHESAALHFSEPTMRAPLAAVEAQIDAAIAPLRAARKVGDEPIAFAILLLNT